MYRRKKYDVWASEIAGYLNKPFSGKDFLIADPRDIKTPATWKANISNRSDFQPPILLLAEHPLEGNPYAGFISSDDPDWDVANILLEFFAALPIHEKHPTALISPEATIGRNVLIGAFSIIGPDVQIGDNTKIYHHVKIIGPVSIGKFCTVKDGAVIGSEGWSFIKNKAGESIHPPQLGLIKIEDSVWIGANSTIERALLDETIIQAQTKIDDLVHIGGGSNIGAESEITAGSIIARNVILGNNVRVAPNAVIRENLIIGKGVLIGQGAVILKDLPPDSVFVGNPARELKKKV